MNADQAITCPLLSQSGLHWMQLQRLLEWGRNSKNYSPKHHIPEGAVLDQEVKRVLSHKGALWCVIIFFSFWAAALGWAVVCRAEFVSFPWSSLSTKCLPAALCSRPQTLPTVQRSLLKLLSVRVYLLGQHSGCSVLLEAYSGITP